MNTQRNGSPTISEQIAQDSKGVKKQRLIRSFPWGIEFLVRKGCINNLTKCIETATIDKLTLIRLCIIYIYICFKRAENKDERGRRIGGVGHNKRFEVRSTTMGTSSPATDASYNRLIRHAHPFSDELKACRYLSLLHRFTNTCLLVYQDRTFTEANLCFFENEKANKRIPLMQEEEWWDTMCYRRR
jgi:hypothetical protein